jgi:hypothetical protein
MLSLLWLCLGGQNILVVEKPGTVSNFKYYEGDKIRLRTIASDSIFSGIITMIGDRSIIIDKSDEISISDIKKIYRKRWGYSFLQYLSIFAGLSYVAINTLNGIINNDVPVVPQETLIISGSMVAFGIALTPLTTRKISTDKEKWRVIILDFQ